MKQYGLGMMISSHPRTAILKNAAEFPCALDNGAFSAWNSGYPFDEWAFLRTLSKCRENNLALDFIICPDIVAGGLNSLGFSLNWAKRLPCDKWALAVQDGMLPVHLGSLAFKTYKYLFVGGTVDWKWQTAETWCKLAHREGLKCHIGRCSTVPELRRAKEIGADSCDSTVFVRNDRFDILEEFIDGVQQHLFEKELCNG